MNDTDKTSSIIAIEKWAQSIPVSLITVARWRKKGWLKTINISGRVYITPEAISEFKARAESAEFAKDHPKFNWKG